MEERVRILCVDDERNVLKALERVFLDDDYDILCATSGPEGLEILENEPGVQIVLSDYRMPEMSGVDFLGEVYRRLPDTVRIVLSGYADAASVVAAINEGHIYKFISKPWNDDELRSAIRDALERYFLKKTNRELIEELKEKNDEFASINRNLEAIVAERTMHLLFQKKVLEYSQNILSSLPVGIVGIDMNGMVVQANDFGIKIVASDGGGILGLDRDKALPEVLNRFVDKLITGSVTVDRVMLNGAEYKVKGRVMSGSEQEGVVLVLDRWGEDVC